jgi:rare lipoprotein A
MKCRGTIHYALPVLISTLLLTTPQKAHAESGIASIYSGEKTANGEYAHAHRYTAAHKTLPFGTFVEVTNRKTGRSVIVRINDRGPFVKGRVIDLTPAGAKAIGFDGHAGLAPVTITPLGRFAHEVGPTSPRG